MVPYEKTRYNLGFGAPHWLVNRSPHYQSTWYHEGRLMENRIFEFWRTTLVREQETLEPTWYPVGAGERGECSSVMLCTQPQQWVEPDINQHSWGSIPQSKQSGSGHHRRCSGSWQREFLNWFGIIKQNEWVGIVIRRFSDECIIVEGASGSSRHTPKKIPKKSRWDLWWEKLCTKVLVIAQKTFGWNSRQASRSSLC